MVVTTKMKNRYSKLLREYNFYLKKAEAVKPELDELKKIIEVNNV